MWNCFWPNFNIGFNSFMAPMMPFYGNFFGCQPMNFNFGFTPQNFSIFNFTPKYNSNLFAFSSQLTFNWSFNKTNPTSQKSKEKSQDGMGAIILRNAKGYVGKVNSDAEGNRLFSPGGRAQGWCYDFVARMLEKSGINVPKIFITTSSPIVARDEAIKRGAYVKNPKAGDLHKGDILVTEGKGPSGLHVGIVDRVENGKIYTVSGNSSNSVRESSYALNSGKVYGVIQTENLA